MKMTKWTHVSHQVSIAEELNSLWFNRRSNTIIGGGLTTSVEVDLMNTDVKDNPAVKTRFICRCIA